MKGMLKWLVDGEVPTPEDLQKLEMFLSAHFAVIYLVRWFPPKEAFIMMLRIYLILEIMEEGMRRVREAIEQAMRENPALALMFLLMEK